MSSCQGLQTMRKSCPTGGFAKANPKAECDPFRTIWRSWLPNNGERYAGSVNLLFNAQCPFALLAHKSRPQIDLLFSRPYQHD